MGDEFQGDVCGGSWWNSSRNLFSSSPCSAAVNDLPWLNPSFIVDMKTTKSLSDDSDGGSSVVLQESNLTDNGNMPFDSTTVDWNQDLPHDSARSQENYSHTPQPLNSSMNCRQKIAHDNEWTSLDFSGDSSPNSFQQVCQSFLFQCQDLPPTMNNTSYTSSLLLQSLFDADSQPHQTSLDSPNFGMNSTGLVLSNASSMMKPSFPKQQSPPVNSFQFHSKTSTFCTASLPLSSTLNQPNFSSKHHDKRTEKAESLANGGGNEPSFKRPRIETPSLLPTFKVRKEKLGDRVTALQQLVSPFGKTDTASVLHEAIEYIKLLHDQVTVLSTPYLKNGQPPLQRPPGLDDINDQEEKMEDLRSRGLCLVPISSTFPVATETTADFWTPTFGRSFM